MTPPLERRPTLRKATVDQDVVAGLTSSDNPTQVTPTANPGDARAAAAKEPHEPGLAPAATRPHVTPGRRLGRPRGRRRMEPFSSKIEISLRDEIDVYVAQYDESYVDLLDRALRAAITQPPPG